MIDTNNKRNPFALFLEFARFGCFTFGGGWSIIAQMQQYYGDRRKEITSQELNLSKNTVYLHLRNLEKGN